MDKFAKDPLSKIIGCLDGTHSPMVHIMRVHLGTICLMEMESFTGRMELSTQDSGKSDCNKVSVFRRWQTVNS